MPFIKVYHIEFKSKGGDLVASLIIEATNKVQVKKVANQLKQALLPILIEHQEGLGFKPMSDLETRITIK